MLSKAYYSLGYSGGPLVVRQKSHDGSAFYMQVGIVSFGGTSCERGNYIIYIILR